MLVFARAPVPGAAKTRLIPRLGAWRAAHLQARLTRLALRTARGSGMRVELHAAGSHLFFRCLRVPLAFQAGKDLGERMSRAFERASRRHRYVVLVGSDCPALAPADLRKSVRLLQGGADVVLAPAEDGGYALIAMRKARRALFDGIDWGSATVLEGTRARARALGLSLRELRTVWDVDRPEDLERLRAPRFASGRRRGARR